MRNKYCLRKKDVVMAFGCAVILLAALGSIGDGGRRRAKEAACVCNLKRWGDIWESYADDHEGCFPQRDGMAEWQHTARAYYRDQNLLLCPEATRSWLDAARNPFMAWEDDTAGINYKSSYCLNLWISNEHGSGKLGSGVQEFWRTPYVKGAASVPVLGDGQWRDADPVCRDMPPLYELDIWTPNMNEMQRFCISRHNGGVNIVFLDWSVRKVGLKYLWRQQWHQTFDLEYPLPVWPPWMYKFKNPPE
ncbi:MAG: hypothetical protein ACYTEX_05860 [Planctomycetota bacterium]